MKYVIEFPTVDGTVITRPAYEAFSKGAFNRVPIVTGLVRDEQAYFLPESRTHKPLTDDDYRRYAASFGAGHAQALLKAYPREKYASASLAEIAMAQGAKACTLRLLVRQWSKYVTVYAYQFNDRTAPSYFPKTSYPMRAYHTAELQYLFPMFRGGRGTAHTLNAAQTRLSDLMVGYWTGFARYGDPAGTGKQALPRWPRYAAERDNVQLLGLGGPKTVDGYGSANDCALWDKVLAFGE